MGEDLLDHRPVLDAGDDPQRSPVAGAALAIDSEDAPQAPGAEGDAPGGTDVVGTIEHVANDR